MTRETIVAAFDTANHAAAAARAVEASGILASDITQHAGGETTTPVVATDRTPVGKQPGFWAKLFGEGEDYAADASSTRDHAVYDRTMAGGGSVLSIKIANVEQDADRVLAILDAHNPVDIEERAAGYTDMTATNTTTNMGTSTAYTANAGQVGTTGTAQTIQLAEEALVVGKRIVNRGTTRIRRYVVETPVSQDVWLHQENVSVERRPASGDAVAADAFADKTIEVTEMNEEAVVGKTARVVEEVVVRKDASGRVETVKDTVRREQVEVEKVDDLTAKGPVTSTTTRTN